MNTHTTTESLATSLAASISSGADRLAAKADQALQGTQDLTNGAAAKVNQGVEQLRSSIPASLSHTAAQAEELARRSLERAREVSHLARERAVELRQATASRVQADPMKAVLIAAAAGAATALLVQWLARARRVD